MMGVVPMRVEGDHETQTTWGKEVTETVNE